MNVMDAYKQAQGGSQARRPEDTNRVSGQQAQQRLGQRPAGSGPHYGPAGGVMNAPNGQPQPNPNPGGFGRPGPTLLGIPPTVLPPGGLPYGGDAGGGMGNVPMGPSPFGGGPLPTGIPGMPEPGGGNRKQILDAIMALGARRVPLRFMDQLGMDQQGGRRPMLEDVFPNARRFQPPPAAAPPPMPYGGGQSGNDLFAALQGMGGGGGGQFDGSGIGNSIGTPGNGLARLVTQGPAFGNGAPRLPQFNPLLQALQGQTTRY